MARLLLISIQKTVLPFHGVAFFVVLLGVLSVFSIVGFLCGSHGGLKRSNTYKREVHLGDKKPRKISKLGCGLSSKALLMTKMISWKKVDECDDEDVGDDQEAVWKRTIIMGERCRPLEFSGKISYDDNGNPMPESPRKHVASADNVVGLQKS